MGEPPDPYGHRVDRPAPEHLHQPMAYLFQTQALFDPLPVLLGHLGRAREPEEVGRVEQEHV